MLTRAEESARPIILTGKENVMYKKLILLLSIILLISTACAQGIGSTPTQALATEPVTPIVTRPSTTISPTQAAVTESATPVVTQPPTAVTPTQVDPTPGLKQYSNDVFGLSFQYPSSWFGPDEYVSGQTLRLAVGSDVVYPYGEPPEQPSNVKNSYNVVIQYTKDDQNTYGRDLYQSLVNLQDGESVSNARGKITRVRQLELGKFTGFEYIATLSETAQTDYFYSREVILVDDKPDGYSVVTISGSPNNVEVSPGADWREVYQKIDSANLDAFHGIVESLTINN
jgi:hypothetical protein